VPVQKGVRDMVVMVVPCGGQEAIGISEGKKEYKCKEHHDMIPLFLLCFSD